MEQQLINNAKNIREIIEGLRIMGDNLDNAKMDLADRLNKIKKDPKPTIITLPATTQPAGIAFEEPLFNPDYDPLPALAGGLDSF